MLTTIFSFRLIYIHTSWNSQLCGQTSTDVSSTETAHGNFDMVKFRERSWLQQITIAWVRIMEKFSQLVMLRERNQFRVENGDESQMHHAFIYNPDLLTLNYSIHHTTPAQEVAPQLPDSFVQTEYNSNFVKKRACCPSQGSGNKPSCGQHSAHCKKCMQNTELRAVQLYLSMYQSKSSTAC